MDSDDDSSEASDIHVLDYVGSRQDQDHDYSEVSAEEPPLPVDSTFDLTLPATHSYLGQDLEEVRGRFVMLEGSCRNLPLLITQSAVLFPGQTLPITEFRTHMIDMLQTCIQNDRTFGVVSFGHDVGTTAEIYEYAEANQGRRFCLKAKGRQRFKILYTMESYVKSMAYVKILPEVTLGPPLYNVRLVSLDCMRVQPTDEKEARRQEKVERTDSALTQWPAWVYRQYDPIRLSFRIRHYLQFIENRGSNVPTDPTNLSFWVAQNVLVNERERISVLKYDCAISRLQQEIKYLIDDRVFVCVKCQNFIGRQLDIFPMSKEGPQGAYCNRNGIIYETVTLYRASGLLLNRERPTAEYSWFPGYGWTIATCKNCGAHIGWKFTALNSNLRPALFWGLTRESLKDKKLLRKERGEGDADPDDSDSGEEISSD